MTQEPLDAPVVERTPSSFPKYFMAFSFIYVGAALMWVFYTHFPSPFKDSVMWLFWAKAGLWILFGFLIPGINPKEKAATITGVILMLIATILLYASAQF